MSFFRCLAIATVVLLSCSTTAEAEVERPDFDESVHIGDAELESSCASDAADGIQLLQSRGTAMRGAAAYASIVDSAEASLSIGSAYAAEADDSSCAVGAHVKCPGSNARCAGEQCCPATPESNNESFPCPSAPAGFKACGTLHKVEDCTPAPCLCTFDVDRTLTGKQDVTDGVCPDNEVFDIEDTAYGGGNLTLSAVGQDICGTFCSKCYIGIVTAGDVSGFKSDEREELVERLSQCGTLPTSEWTGPSKFGENRTNCSGAEIDSTLVAGCSDATKQYAVESILEWLDASEGVVIPKDRVWHFDDRENNVEPFEDLGFNAREVSCATREGPVGLCGATMKEIKPAKGVKLCPSE